MLTLLDSNFYWLQYSLSFSIVSRCLNLKTGIPATIVIGPYKKMN